MADGESGSTACHHPVAGARIGVAEMVAMGWQTLTLLPTK